MRILNLVHQYLPEFVGGTELYTQALSAALQQLGHEVAIFHRAYRGAPGLTRRRDREITVWAASAGPLSPTQRFLSTFRHGGLHQDWLEALDTFAPDLVHVQHLMGLPISLLDVLAERQIPYVITLLDYWWLCPNANLLTNYDHRICNGPRWHLNCTHCVVARSGSHAAWLTAPLVTGALAWRASQLRRLLDNARLLLAPSDFVNRWYAEHGVSAAKLQTVPWGVILPTPEPSPPMKDPRPVDMLYVGGLAPNKGVHVLLEAFSQLQGDARLTIVGDETAHPDYSRRLHELAGPNVRFAGRLGRSQVWHAMRSADVLLVPSLWHETFCLVAHEARAAGTPVVASHIGALTEAVRDEVDGLLLPPGDVAAWHAAMQRLVAEPDLLARYRAQVRPPLDFPAHVAQVATVYQQTFTTPDRTTVADGSP